MNMKKIMTDIRHLNLFDAINTVVLKSCEQLANDSEEKMCWIVASDEIERLSRPLCVTECEFLCVQDDKMPIYA